jgi:hypothetical protein
MLYPSSSRLVCFGNSFHFFPGRGMPRNLGGCFVRSVRLRLRCPLPIALPLQLLFLLNERLLRGSGAFPRHCQTVPSPCCQELAGAVEASYDHHTANRGMVNSKMQKGHNVALKCLTARLGNCGAGTLAFAPEDIVYQEGLWSSSKAITVLVRATSGHSFA